jgi:putative SOS response-associated peptidase YedK
MCGRYTLTKPLVEIKFHFSPLLIQLDFQQRFNIAPTQQLPIVIQQDQQRQLVPMIWGLVPSWAKDKSFGARLINARGESVHEKPSFRDSFKQKRCLVPADGFIEWAKQGMEKIPHYIQLKNQGLVAFAGIWSEWKKQNTHLITYSIITTQANDLLLPIHDRMPVILSPQDYNSWLDPKTDQETLCSLLVPFPEDLLTVRQISKSVNSAKNDQPEVLHSD